eukprot:TRINITY_DN7196_c0_g4_i1.p1 TRINITY_DN7196_c0_g4~~TRINITY_DN7196_c0_g4_i1.p1  ORF type:complete len:502 (+),score=28.82 TRINITY_DN7196_c0_g4_i1:589-2094(+)
MANSMTVTAQKYLSSMTVLDSSCLLQDKPSLERRKSTGCMIHGFLKPLVPQHKCVSETVRNHVHCCSTSGAFTSSSLSLSQYMPFCQCQRHFSCSKRSQVSRFEAHPWTCHCSGRSYSPCSHNYGQSSRKSASPVSISFHGPLLFSLERLQKTHYAMLSYSHDPLPCSRHDIMATSDRYCLRQNIWDRRRQSFVVHCSGSIPHKSQHNNIVAGKQNDLRIGIEQVVRSSRGAEVRGPLEESQQRTLKDIEHEYLQSVEKQEGVIDVRKEEYAIKVEEVYLSRTTESASGPFSAPVNPVLRGCSLEVPKGAFWMLLGPNGCGKSTLLKALAGLLKPSEGRMEISGSRSYVFQNPDHQVVMPSVACDVAFGLGGKALPREEVERRVATALAAVGMADYSKRQVQTLSGGQKQRVAIAGALAEDRQVLLLDELTTFLDDSDQVGVLDAVRDVVGGPGQVTALWVTHRLEELAYADGAAYMEEGRVAISGSVAEVRMYLDRISRH